MGPSAVSGDSIDQAAQYRLKGRLGLAARDDVGATDACWILQRRRNRSRSRRLCYEKVASSLAMIFGWRGLLKNFMTAGALGDLQQLASVSAACVFTGVSVIGRCALVVEGTFCLQSPLGRDRVGGAWVGSTAYPPIAAVPGGWLRRQPWAKSGHGPTAVFSSRSAINLRSARSHEFQEAHPTIA